MRYPPLRYYLERVLRDMGGVSRTGPLRSRRSKGTFTVPYQQRGIQACGVTSQAAWCRMENGPKSKNGKNWPKNRKGPSARSGEKMVQKWRKKKPKSHFFAIFVPFFPEGHFLFFGQSFPVFGLRPVFHSIPGGLTRKCGVSWQCYRLLFQKKRS